jgi:hypothetical protein
MTGIGAYRLSAESKTSKAGFPSLIPDSDTTRNKTKTLLFLYKTNIEND